MKNHILIFLSLSLFSCGSDPEQFDDDDQEVSDAVVLEEEISEIYTLEFNPKAYESWDEYAKGKLKRECFQATIGGLSIYDFGYEIPALVATDFCSCIMRNVFGHYYKHQYRDNTDFIWREVNNEGLFDVCMDEANILNEERGNRDD